MLDDIIGFFFWVGFFGAILFGVVEIIFSNVDRSTCRDMVTTSININLQDGGRTYTASNEDEEIEFDSVKEIKVGTLVNVCDINSAFGVLHIPPSVEERITK